MTSNEPTSERTPLLGTDAPPERSPADDNLSQAYLLGLISLLNTGLWIALTNLGSAGQEDPYVVMLSNAIGFSLSCPLALHGGALLNVLGLKPTVTLCTLPYPLYPLSLLYYARHGTAWPLILSSILCNICGGIKGATEGAIVLGYSTQKTRGQFISIFLTSVNVAPIIGGIINLVLNYGKDEVGRVSDATYIIFTVLMALGTPASLLLRSPSEAVSSNASPPSSSSPVKAKSWLEDVKEFYSLLLQPQYLLLLPVFITCGYAPAYIGLFSTLFFTVRARSVLSLFSAVAYVAGATAFGKFSKKLKVESPLKSTWNGLWVIMATGWIAFLFLQLDLSTSNSGIDPSTPLLFAVPAAVLVLHRFSLGAVEAFEWWVIGTAGDESEGGEERGAGGETEAMLDVARLAGVLRACDQVGACAGFGIGAAAERGGLNMHWQVGINVGLWGLVYLPTRKALRWMA